MQSRTFRLLFAVIAVLAVSLYFVSSAGAVAVTGPWTICPGQGTGPITDINTNQPVVGDGTANSADGEMFDSPLQSAITLANDGDRIQFTGHVRLTGTVGTASGPKTQFRYGLFKDDDGSTDRLNWIGYYMSNRSGGTNTPHGTLARKPVGNGSAYLSVTNQNSLATAVGNDINFSDDLYALDLTIERFNGGDLFVTGNIAGAANTFTQSLSASDVTASINGTYTFDRLGFLLGSNLDTDKAEFFNLDVAFLPGPASFEPGDYNRNGTVDGADYVLWRQDRTPLDNEVSGVTDLDTTPEDYDAWRERFGNPTSGGGGGLGGGTSVPEPATLTILALAGLLALGRRSRCF